MSNFISKFIRNGQLGNLPSELLLKVHSAGPGVKVAGLSNLLQVINGLYVNMSNKCQVAAEILPALCFDQNFVPDDLPSSDDFNSASLSRCIAEIPQESATIILSSLQSVIEFGSKTVAQGSAIPGITMTSASGYQYELIPLQNVSIGSDEILIATTQNPQSTADALLYRNNGKYYLNTRVRSKGYWRNAQYIPPTTIVGCVESIKDWLDAPSIASDILTSLRDIANQLQVSLLTDDLDILECCYIICSENNIPYSGILFTDLLAIDHWCYERNLNTEYGVMQYLGDIVHDEMVNDSINNVLLAACDLLRSGKFSVDSFIGATKAYLDNCTAAVKSVFSSVCNAFSAGGPYGAIRYIIEFIRDGNSFTPIGDDGAMAFTNNKSLVPAEYIAGIVCTIAGAVVSIIGLIVSVIGYGVGYAIAILGSLLMQIPQAINYDYETATLATVVCDENKATLPYFPHAAYQRTVSISGAFQSMKDAFADGVNCFYVCVPGGMLLVGPDSDSRYARVEFHPAVADFDSTILFPGATAWRRSTQEGGGGTSLTYTIAGMLTPTWNISRESIIDAWATAQPLDVSINDSGLVSSTADDEKLRWAVLKNTALFAAWLDVITGWGYSTPTYTGWGGQVLLIQASWVLQQTIPGSGFDYIIGVKNVKNNSGYTGVSFDYPNILAASLSVVQQYSTVPSWTSIGSLFSNWSHFDSGSDYGYCTYIRSSDFDQNPLNVNSFRRSHASNWTQSAALSISYLFSRGWFTSNILPIPQQLSWMVLTPKYNRSTFFTWVFVAVAVTVVAVVVTVIASVAIKRFCVKQQAMNAAKVEKAWDNFKSDPSAENYQAYRKAAFKANMKACIVGGTKYSYSSYWNASNATTEGSSMISEASNTFIPGYFNGEYNVDDGLAVANAKASQVDAMDDNIDGLYTLIRGI